MESFKAKQIRKPRFYELKDVRPFRRRESEKPMANARRTDEHHIQFT
jgi:hypothetical protein